MTGLTGRAVVVGDVLLDRDIIGVADRLSPDAPVPVLTETAAVERPGGAGLAATFLARDGADVVLVAALGCDDAGYRLRALLARFGVRVAEVPYDGPTTEKVRLRAGHHPLLRLDRGVAPGTFATVPRAVTEAIATASVVIVSDYGRGITALPPLRRTLAERAGRVPVVWDPHPKGSSPVAGTRLVCPNRAEAATFAATLGADVTGDGTNDLAAVAAEAVVLRSAWHVHAVAVTLGPRGAMVAELDRPLTTVATMPTDEGDPCGAGDRFTTAAVLALAEGATVPDAVRVAVRRASEYVAADGPATLQDGTEPVVEPG